MATSADRDPPVIGFLTDFGLDGAAATCRAVMLSICPHAQIVDIAHTVPKFAVADGAFILAGALPYFPVGAHLAVVDPGVGTARRPVAVRAGRGDVLVGPDNGLLVPAADALGGAVEAHELENRAWWLPVTSATFHGRDVFAPVVAHLTAGSATLASLGPKIDPAQLVRLPEPQARVAGGVLETEVVYIDTFGNVRLAGTGEQLRDAIGPEGTAVGVALGGVRHEARFVRTFGEVEAGRTLVYVDSSGRPAIGLREGDLASATGALRGDRVTIERGRQP